MTAKHALEAHGLRPVRRYGQNFLTDSNISTKIAEIAGICGGDTVIEIGAGLGALTAKLCEKAARVVVIEIDRRLEQPLCETIAPYCDIDIIWGDALKIDFRPPNLADKAILCANLPYYITTPIIFKLIESRDFIRRAVIMTQKEVAERICAPPGGKEYGALTVACNYYAHAEIVMTVSRNCFYPAPDVESAVLRLDFYEPNQMPIRATDEKKMFDIVRAAFATRRKTLANCLKAAGFERGGKLPPLRSMGLADDVRGERLSVSDFARLSELISKLEIECPI